MTNKFKVGDRVRCVDNEQTDLVEGEVYTVHELAGSMAGVYLDQDRLQLYLSCRFEAAPQKDEAALRKSRPVVTGVLDYFSAAIAAVAECSKAGNDQHSPGQEMHWDRSKSGDEADALVRHLMERGTVDSDGIRHSAKVAWRALALLQKELEEAGAPVSRASRNKP